MIGDKDNEGINTYNKAMAICESADDIESREKAIQEAQLIVQTLKSTGHPKADQMLSGLNQTSLMVHGVKQLLLGNANDSIKTFEQALKFYKANNDKSGELQTLMNLSSAHEMLGGLDSITTAIEKRLEAVKIAADMGDKGSQYIALFSLGILYEKLVGAKIPIVAPHLDMMWYDQSSFSQGVAQLAKSYFEKSLMVARELGDREKQGMSLAHFALALNHLGDRDQAIKSLETSIDMLGNKDPRTNSLINILSQMRSK
jgi:tetratricopeptide (TPR) repeat protein